jgi:arsenite-transporting ATPase
MGLWAARGQHHAAGGQAEGRRALPLTHFQFIGGKGGVGKTTCAAAIAVDTALRGRRTLVISTDPAPSLGDALGVRLGRRPKRIPLRRGSLHAAEVDAAAVIRQWLSPRSATLRDIALRGTWLDREDVDRLLALSLPGIDELAGLLELVRLSRLGTYDAIIVDTAPTGHTLRMLAMPDTLGGLAHAFSTMQQKHRAMVEALRGFAEPDAADGLVDELDADSRELADLLRDRDSTAIVWVTLPELMAVEETLDALHDLAGQGMAVDTVLVNRVLVHPDAQCMWCRTRASGQRSAVSSLAAALSDRNTKEASLIRIAERRSEPVGLAWLARIGREIRERQPPVVARRRSAQAADTGRRPGIRGSAPALRDVAPCDLFRGPLPSLVLFGGKGGVGKTSCAAAAALALARQHAGHRVLLLSVDPAHSLADVLGVPIGDRARTLPRGPSNLLVREIDASRAIRQLREQYRSAIDGLFDRVGGDSRFDAAYDRRVMHALIDLAPPGLDEIVAMLEVTTSIMGTGPTHHQAVVVIDTAPSGHALRLLEMPALLQEWTNALMRMLLKYQPIVRIGELGAVLLDMSRRIGRLRTMLTDPRQAHFIIVTRAAALPRAETTRLLRALRRLRIQVPAVLVNAVGAGTCADCRSAARQQTRELSAIARIARTRSASRRIVIAGAELPPPHGVERLLAWQERWKGVADQGSGVRSQELGAK